MAALQVNCTQDVLGDRGVHPPKHQVSDDPNHSLLRERPFHLLRGRDIELLENLHAHTTAVGGPDLIQKDTGSLPFVASGLVVRVHEDIGVDEDLR